MLDTSECGPLKIHREGVMALTAAEERRVKRAHAQKFTITSETFLLPFFFFFLKENLATTRVNGLSKWRHWC